MESIIIEIGKYLIFSGSFAWLVRELIKHLLSKNILSYKNELDSKTEQYKIDLSQSLRQFEHDLEIIASKTTRLHEKRLERIENLYSYLIEYETEMNNMVSGKIVTGMTDEEVKRMEFEDVRKAGEAGQTFFEYYNKNKLFFNKDTCDLIEEIISNLKTSHQGVSLKYVFQNISPEMNYQNYKKAGEMVREVVPKIKLKLEDNFRTIIGVK